MITVSELRQALGSSPSIEARISDLRLEVLDLWDTITGREWRWDPARIDIVRFDRLRPQRAFLSLRPVASVAKVESLLDDGTWEEVDADTWVLVDAEMGELRSIDVDFESTIRITYAGGYTEDGESNPRAPADIRNALIVQAAYSLQRQSADKLVVRSQALPGGASTSYLDAEYHPVFQRAAKRRQT